MKMFLGDYILCLVHIIVFISIRDDLNIKILKYLMLL